MANVVEEHDRSIAAKIERLRQRILALGNRDASARPVLDILKGVLDLLEDEL